MKRPVPILGFLPTLKTCKMLEYVKKHLKTEKQLERSKKKFAAEVRKSGYIQELSQKFSESEINHLVDSIVRKKVQLLGQADFLSKEWDKFHLQYVTYAHKLLELILSKKLFNLELQWRAEEITIPGVEICDDFRYWSEDIGNCPFLDPITDREIEALKLFMRSNNFEIKNWTWDSGLDYDFDQFMEKNEKGDLDRLPEFFEYYDGMLGTFYLLNKPDYRKPKEDRYIQLMAQDRRKKWEKKQAKIKAGLEPAHLPSFNPYGQDGDEVLAQTEPEDFWELEAAKKKPDLNLYFHRTRLETIFEYFQCNRHHDIRLPGWLQWHEAMEQAYNQHRNARALDVLELALEEYRMKADLGLFNTREVEKQKKQCISRKFILKGRKLAGEKPDFDF